MDDIVSDWYDEDDGESQFPRAAEDGWGIDESEYTSTLDTSKLTPEQIRVAEMLAKQIQEDSVVSKVRGVKQNKGPPQSQASLSFQQMKAQMQGMPAPQGQNQAQSFQQGYSPLDRLQQQQPYSQNPAAAFQQPPPQAPAQDFSQFGGQAFQQPQRPPPVPPGPQITPPAQQMENERKVVQFLQAEMRRVLDLIGNLGEPTGQQAGKLLGQYTQSVTSLIPFSPADVKHSVVSAFFKCNWSVLERKPVRGTSPPNGKTLCDLIYELGVYFCQRVGTPTPPPGYVEKKLGEIRAASAARLAANAQKPPTPNVAGNGTTFRGNNSSRGGRNSYNGRGGGRGGRRYDNGRGGGRGGRGDRDDGGRGGRGGRGRYNNDRPRGRGGRSG